jgi:hypothetical protein
LAPFAFNALEIKGRQFCNGHCFEWNRENLDGKVSFFSFSLF